MDRNLVGVLAGVLEAAHATATKHPDLAPVIAEIVDAFIEGELHRLKRRD